VIFSFSVFSFRRLFKKDLSLNLGAWRAHSSPRSASQAFSVFLMRTTILQLLLVKFGEVLLSILYK
jgi:hypothetical protein